MEKFNSKIAGFIILTILSTSFSPLFAQRAHAQWVVLDPANLAVNVTGKVKEFGLDSIAWIIVNIILERMAASTVNWINSGFKGSPAFVTDPEAYFQDIGDKLAGQYIFTNPNLSFLCGPISAKIRLALQTNYIGERQWQCTLTQVGRNMDNFMSSFENGGWDSFFEISQTQHMNPIGAYLQAENEMVEQIESKANTKLTELNQGKGFMSYQKCVDVAPNGFVGPVQNAAPSNFVGPLAPGQTRMVEKCETVTPGSVIQGQLDKVLGSGGDKLVAADEINEIVSALLNQLVSRVVGGIGSGLRGASSPDSSSGGQTFTNQLSNSSQKTTTDYFGNTQDTSAADIPIPDPNAGRPAGSQPIWPSANEPLPVEITNFPPTQN